LSGEQFGRVARPDFRFVRCTYLISSLADPMSHPTLHGINKVAYIFEVNR
jgi:hypothetical protein